MHHKESALCHEEYDPYHHQAFASYDSQEEYYKKMAEIKDKNIQDLLNELKETKEIYQEYKNQYFAEEKRLKTKFAEMASKCQTQSAQLQKCKMINAKIKSELEIGSQRERKLLETHESHVRQLKNCLIQLEASNKELSQQRASLAEKCETLQDKYARIEEKLRKRQAQAHIYQQETKSLRDEILKKESQWEEERRHLHQRIQEAERKKAIKSKTNNKLDDLQNRIKHTLMKM